MTEAVIRLRGVRQNNLRGFDLDIAHGQMTVVTGVSGSGKSSLAFDTLFAEGQRRYVECLSTYARQFIERMDRPAMDDASGILPAVSLRQSRGLRSARATVATLCDAGGLFRAVFAHASNPSCPTCGGAVARQPLTLLADDLLRMCAGQRAVVAFALPVVSVESARGALGALTLAGYHRAFEDGEAVDVSRVLTAERVGTAVEVVQDRMRLDSTERGRLLDSLSEGLRRGAGLCSVYVERAPPAVGSWRLHGHSGSFTWLRAATTRRCTACGIEVGDPSPQLFSPTSAVGACEACNGFGRVPSLDLARAIPDPGLSLVLGAIKVWTTEATRAERHAMLEFCAANGIDDQVPWRSLPAAHQALILDGEPGKKRGRFEGVRGWFRWLESKQYKMHVRVQLARYRTYEPCTDCNGTRIKSRARLWRIDGLDLPTWMALPVRQVVARLRALQLDDVARQAVALPLADLLRRAALLDEIGLHYLTFDRQGRTLSGGELQRVQLVAALATGLSQVLYVLDEPSIGLHARDNDRLLRILERLKAAGNTVVVVEHDPALILAADQAVELGPGAGELGGRLLYSGPAAGLAEVAESPTGAYLSGRSTVLDLQAMPPPQSPRGAVREVSWLTVDGATGHNLRGQTVRFAHGQLNVVCGVSGSGKSTLVVDTLFKAVARAFGQQDDPPEHFARISGVDAVRGAALVDQSPPARSTRANCATYLELWDVVRKRLLTDPVAAQRGYTTGTFSFNKADGRCPTCEGLGIQTVDMQFLSDVAMTCETCAGRRFRSEVLDVRFRGWNVARFLDATSSEVAATFGDDSALCAPAQRLCNLGLGYLRLGQPLSTLSGGELQRVKLARYLLWGGPRMQRGLYVLDEPTTGLHLQDVACLLRALRELTAAGHTVVVIEHHLDVIAAADHVVELGPDGGPEGGHVLHQGPVDELVQILESPTAQALRAHKHRHAYVAAVGVQNGEVVERDPGVIQIRGARVHNLKNLALDVPRDRFTVVTGLSGSGKSSLAFDLVFAEGQRRFLDCLSPFARQYLPPTVAPDVDSLRGLLPTVAIAQRTTRGGPKSTVATLTDTLPYLRLLFARCGTQSCPRCGGEVGAQSPDVIAAHVAHIHRKDARFAVTAPAVRGRKGHHSDVVERARSLGHAWIAVDGALCSVSAVPVLGRHQVHDLDYVVALLRPGAPMGEVARAVADALRLGDGTAGSRAVVTATQGLQRSHVWSIARHCAACQAAVEPPNPRLFSFTSPAGWCPACEGTGMRDPPKAALHDPDADPKSSEALAKAGLADGGEAVELQPVRAVDACPTCQGARLRPEALAVRLAGKNLAQALDLGPAQLLAWIDGLALGQRDALVAAPIVADLRSRCAFLSQVGLDYLPLGRPAMTLSGGESQRLRLAAQLGSNLRGVLYVLDEPTIGLHPVDNARVLDALQLLRSRGNGLLVVEHDEETIRRADHVIELGPGGGQSGGEVVFEGTVAEMLASPLSPTGAALRQPAGKRTREASRDVAGDTAMIALHGATLHNLRGGEARFARGRLNVVTGVSGSGKSTLVRDVLVGAASSWLVSPTMALPPALGSVEGLAGIGAVSVVDQTPIGRTPRSCPATYMGIFDTLRQTYASLPAAKVAGLTASEFSFNAGTGRCDACGGTGQIRVEMSFLPTVAVPCEACHGQRYGERVLGVAYKGKNLAQVLAMSMAEAAAHFAALRAVAEPLRLCERIGLGYLTLGQSSDTLSGGEAQRLKLVAELAKRRRTETLYVLDEPSTGLHLRDVQKLMTTLRELVARGDTLVLIEHHLDIIAQADWLVDLGPGAGGAGGLVTWCGTVAELLRAGPEGATRGALLHHWIV
ncbi:MAG: excinuclease ABC subunit UvrA [Deltaproteobacteria bacterium]|nr:excinuclease ABC subunit UvrA [Deltaproteobacteria bacterium]